MKIILAALIAFLLLFPAEGMSQQLQNKEVVRLSVSLDESWYGAVWVIGNIRKDSPDNVNLFPGIGYKTRSWWVEGLWWQNWSKAGAKSAVDARFGITHPEFTLYSELSRFWKTGDVYTFVIVERPVTGKLKVGVETENFFRQKDSLGAGPRVSYALGTFLDVPVATTLSYQVRRQEPDALRLQLTLSPRF